MRLTLQDREVQRRILVGPFRMADEKWVVGRYGVPMGEFVRGGTEQEKCDFLNDWWRHHALD